ncbi:MAG TPA: IclR family transcriptional regulator [Pseudonocardia sp.]|nr:IclR family transcriptional regulator [Pseudonocardia sp.]
MGATERTTGGGSVKSAGRALAILDAVADRGPLRFNELVSLLDLPRSSAHGLLQTLVDRGWLDLDADTRRYTIGLRAWHVGQAYTGHGDLVAVAKPVMDALARDVGETVQLARLDGIENVYIAISESAQPMRLASTVGARLLAHSTGIGKALLAQLDPQESARLVRSVALPRFTEHTVTDPGELDALVAQARTRGFALDDEELLIGCRCVAVPLTDDGNGLVTALSVTAPTARCGPDWPHDVLGELRTAAGIIRARTPTALHRPG